MNRLFGFYKSKPKGQTACYCCNLMHNNAHIPRFCSCGAELGGKHEPARNMLTGAKVINNELVSVRRTRRGTNIRIFVNLMENKVKMFILEFCF